MLIQLYLFRQLLLSVGFSMAGIALIMLPTIAIQAVNKLGAVSLNAVARYLPLVVAELVPYLLPMAFLLGVVATYGRLSAERELIAIKMAGIHPAKLCLPALVIAALLSLGTNHLLDEVSPTLKFRQRSYLLDAEVEIFRNLARGRTELRFGKGSLLAEEAYDNVYRGVLLDLPGKDGPELTIAADEAVLDVGRDTLSIHLQEAYVLTDTARLYDQSPSYTLKLSDLFPLPSRDRHKSKYLTNSEMQGELTQGELTAKERQEFVYEIHRRHALSVTYLLFLLLGIPTGVVLRSSTQLGAFTGAVGYGFLYYVLALRLGKVLAETGAVSPIVAAWATNGLFLLVGAVFFVRALWR